jgi:hypothetical protein
MPNRDGKGPNGLGSMTGRAMGNCAGANNSANDRRCFKQGFARGFGNGFNNGRGNCRGFGRKIWTTPEQMVENGKISKETSLDELKAQRDEIEKAIKNIEQENKDSE